MTTNGVNNQKPNGPKLDAAKFTEAVVASMGEKTPERLREVITSLTRHLHAFILETNLTTKEFMAGLELMNWAGRMSDEKRNEGLLLSDVLGLERQVGEIDRCAESGAILTIDATVSPTV
jgi:catechol 1,2-dioxygenase